MSGGEKVGVGVATACLQPTHHPTDEPILRVLASRGCLRRLRVCSLWVVVVVVRVDGVVLVVMVVVVVAVILLLSSGPFRRAKVARAEVGGKISQRKASLEKFGLVWTAPGGGETGSQMEGFHFQRSASLQGRGCLHRGEGVIASTLPPPCRVSGRGAANRRELW